MGFLCHKEQKLADVDKTTCVGVLSACSTFVSFFLERLYSILQ